MIRDTDNYSFVNIGMSDLNVKVAAYVFHKSIPSAFLSIAKYAH